MAFYIYFAVLKRLATHSDYQIPLPSTVPFAHSYIPFTSSQVLRGLLRFFSLPSGFQLVMIFSIRVGSLDISIETKPQTRVDDVSSFPF